MAVFVVCLNVLTILMVIASVQYSCISSCSRWLVKASLAQIQGDPAAELAALERARRVRRWTWPIRVLEKVESSDDALNLDKRIADYRKRVA